MERQKLAIGQKVRIIGGQHRHGWPIGTVVAMSRDEDDDEPEFIDGVGSTQYVPYSNVELAPATLDDIATLVVGTVLNDDKGTIRRVLGICGEVVLFSQAANQPTDPEAHSFRFGHTLEDLKRRGWTVADEEPVKTMTRAEAEAQLGAKIEG